MTLDICTELVNAVAAANGEAVRLKDPTTNQEYVLIKAEVYEHLMLPDDEGLDRVDVGKIHSRRYWDNELEPQPLE